MLHEVTLVGSNDADVIVMAGFGPGQYPTPTYTRLHVRISEGGDSVTAILPLRVAKELQEQIAEAIKYVGEEYTDETVDNRPAGVGG